jgi:uncharacterized protein (DUF1697 family)
MTQTQFCAVLLHSIILGPGKRVVIADLRIIAEEAGFLEPRTLAATGDLVMEISKKLPVADIEATQEKGIAARFGKHIDIIVRTAVDFRELHAGNPFPDESHADGRLVCVRFQRNPLPADLAAAFNDWCGKDDRIRLVRGDLWISFGGKPSGSQLLSRTTTKQLGIGTWRKWNTVLGLAKMLAV